MAHLTRRKLTLLVSGAALLGVVLLVFGGYFAATRTDAGRSLVRDLIVSQVAPRVHGKLYVGRIRGGLIGDVTIDSLEIRGEDDSLFVASGPISLTFDPRDLIDKRVLIRTLEVRRAMVHVKQFPDGEWNFRRIFPSGPAGPPTVGRSFGDFIVIDTTTLHDASFTLTLPWSPNDSLRGARRDSAVRANIAFEDAAIHREGAGFMRSYRWRNGFAASGHIRLAHPDSAGQFFRVSRMDALEIYPPFRFSNIRGEVRRLHDSVWVDLPHFDLAASTGSARGKLVWGSGLPNRYDFRIVGDSVSMSDVAWIYPTLPRTGGGRTRLHIRNDPRDLHVINYALTDMDVRSERSHLAGNMTYGVGGPVLVVKDVQLRADSVDFDLLRTLNGRPFPYDWQGKLVGTVRASGGPVNRFKVEQAAFAFVDAHVPGAISTARASGELDILFPAFTAFRGLRVESDRIDLRTIRFLNADFAPLNGFARGRAVLDSSWLDVRFRDADIEHVDGPAPPSRFTGVGRVTWGEKYMTYDVDLLAAPLSMTTLARSYEYLPFRGLFTGPVRARGTAANLFVDTDLTGAAGHFTWSGLVDTDSSSYAATGEGRFDALDVRALLERPSLASTNLNGRYTTDIRGDSLTNLVGPVDVHLDRSLADSIRIFPSRATLRFTGGGLRVDSARIETTAATLEASGGFGLANGRTDSLRFSLAVDSLGGIRRYLASAEPLTADTLDGRLSMRGVLEGNIGAASLSADLEGSALQRNQVRAGALVGQVDLENVFGARHGTGSLTLDTVNVARLRFPKVTVEGAFLDTVNTTFSAVARGANATQLAVAGRVHRDGGSRTFGLDTLRILAGSSVWNLGHAGRVVLAPEGTSVDSLVLRERRGGRLMLHATLPTEGTVHGELAGDSIALADIALLFQRPDTVQGLLAVSGNLAGTRERPLIRLAADATGLSLGTARVDRLAARAAYEGRRLETSIDWRQAGRQALAGTLVLPIDLALAPRPRRVLDEPLSGRIVADSTDLAIVQTLTTAIDASSGRLAMNVAIGGTFDRPLLNGHLTLDDGEAHVVSAGDVRFRDLTADIAFLGDSLAIRRLSAVSDRSGRENVSLTGGIEFRELANPRFGLRLVANGFHAISNPRIADLWVSSDLQFQGSTLGAVLTGHAEVDKGSVFIPDLVQKRVVKLDDPSVLEGVDTSLVGTRALLPSPPPVFVRNLVVEGARLSMGSDVWLRSSEATINIGGSVSIERLRGVGADSSVRLTLDGDLQTQRGTYRLSVGGLVQRTFEVENGSIRFFPTEATFNPTLNINAIHTVRQLSASATQQDRKIRVTISGTLATPFLTFSSADGAQLSESDLISYLIFGAPAFGIGDATQGTATGTYVSAGFTTLASALSDIVNEKVRNLGVVDVLQIQSGFNRSYSFGDRDVARSVLFGTRVLAGKQINARTYVSGNIGFCGSNRDITSLRESIGNSFGLKVDYRLDAELTMSAGLEPSTAGMLCQTGTETTRGFTQTPSQFGLDITRRWRF